MNSLNAARHPSRPAPGSLGTRARLGSGDWNPGDHRSRGRLQQVETRGLFFDFHFIHRYFIIFRGFLKWKYPQVIQQNRCFFMFFFHIKYINHPSIRVPPFMDTPHLYSSHYLRRCQGNRSSFSGKSAPGETSQARQGQQQGQIAGSRAPRSIFFAPNSRFSKNV